MEEELNSLPATEAQPPAGYSRRRYAVLLVALALFVALIGLARGLIDLTQRTGGSAAGPSLSEAALEGDLAMKFSYACERWMSFAPGGGALSEQMRSFREAQRRAAVRWYRRAVRQDSSVGNVRRLIIAQHPEKRAQEVKLLQKAAGSDVTPSERRGLDVEIAMWRAVYADQDVLPAEEVGAYAARIRGLRLGWYEYLALADLFERAGMTSRAQEERDKAARSASRTVVWLVAVLLVVGALGLVGVGVIIWYVAARKTRRPRADVALPELPPGLRSVASGCLLEVFLVYLVLWTGTQLVAVGLLATCVLLTGDAAAVDMVSVTVGAYVFAGVLAGAYLLWRLRSAEWSRGMVRLASRDPLADVGWGVAGYAAALPFLVVAGVISQVVERYLPTPQNPVVPLFVETETIFGKLALFALVAIAAPFFEELFFRGVLLSSFRAEWGVARGIALSALVFAAVHPLPLGLLPIFVLGSVFAILVYERGSLLSAMVAHGLNNVVALVVLLILTG